MLIEIYEKMATADADLVLSCAFNFPGFISLPFCGCDMF